MSEKIHSNLLEANNAVGSYLDDMLHEATCLAENSVQEIQDFDHRLLPDSLLREEKPALVAPTVIDLAIEKSNALVAEIETEFEIDAAHEVDIELQVESEQVPVPAIALSVESFPLQCLMFKVADNLLSIPLIEMQSVVNWTDNLTRLPQEPDWMLGILKHRDQNVRIVDSVSVLQIRSDKFVKPGHVLVIGDEKWAITCDQIDEVVTLEYEDVQWNTNAEDTLTLGTIRNSLASLLSLQGIIRRLESGI